MTSYACMAVNHLKKYCFHVKTYFIRTVFNQLRSEMLNNVCNLLPFSCFIVRYTLFSLFEITVPEQNRSLNRNLYVQECKNCKMLNVKCIIWHLHSNYSAFLVFNSKIQFEVIIIQHSRKVSLKYSPTQMKSRHKKYVHFNRNVNLKTNTMFYTIFVFLFYKCFSLVFIKYEKKIKEEDAKDKNFYFHVISVSTSVI